MVEVVKDHNIDIIHVHYAIPHASAAITAKKILKEENIDLPIVNVEVLWKDRVNSEALRALNCI